MKLLARYLLKELVVPLVVWVAFLFLLLFVMQFLRGTEVLLGSAVTLGDIGRLILYLAPHFLVMALPLGFGISALGPEPIWGTPGIRPAGAAVGDQKRVGTPASALKDGSSLLVVGRPIRDAADPAAAARSILAEMSGALAPSA